MSLQNSTLKKPSIWPSGQMAARSLWYPRYSRHIEAIELFERLTASSPQGEKKLPYCTHGWWRTKTKEKYGKMHCMLVACSYMPIQRLYLSLFSTHRQPCVNSLYQYKARILNQVPPLQWHSHSPTSEQILPKNWPDEFVTTVTTIIPAEQKEGYWKKKESEMTEPQMFLVVKSIQMPLAKTTSKKTNCFLSSQQEAWSMSTKTAKLEQGISGVSASIWILCLLLQVSISANGWTPAFARCAEEISWSNGTCISVLFNNAAISLWLEISMYKLTEVSWMWWGTLSSKFPSRLLNHMSFFVSDKSMASKYTSVKRFWHWTYASCPNLCRKAPVQWNFCSTSRTPNSGSSVHLTTSGESFSSARACFCSCSTLRTGCQK